MNKNILISDYRLSQLTTLIQNGKTDSFYDWTEWDKVKAEVLKQDQYECQKCKHAGKYKKAKIVHHIKHLKDRPDLALNIYDPDTGERQLISLCYKCHMEEHPENQRKYKPHEPITFERWD